MRGTVRLRRPDRRGRALLGCVALAASLLAAVPLVGTFADVQTVDGDLASPGIQRTVSRAALPSTTISVTARLQVNYQSSSHVAAGSTVQFVVDPATTTLPAGYQVGGASVAIPTSWRT